MDFGQYTDSILISYAVGLVGVFTIVAMSVRAQRRVKIRIRNVEKRDDSRS